MAGDWFYDGFMKGAGARRTLARLLSAVLLVAGLTGCVPWPRAEWSPDGTRLALVAEDGVWVVDCETRKPKSLYRSARLISGAIWAEKEAALLCLEASADSREILLRRVPLDGGEAQTTHAFDCPREAVHEAVKDAADFDEARGFLNLCLRPAGSLLAVELPISEDDVETRVFDTADNRTLAVLDGLRAPRWSPDGKMLACVRLGDEDRRSEVTLFIVEGRSVTRQRSVPIGKEEGDSDAPAHLSWSSDSRMILTGDGEGIWLVHADGSRPAEAVAEGLSPSFNRGSRQFSLLRKDDREESDDALVLFLRDLDSTNEVELARQNVGFMPALAPVSWSPDGGSRATVWFAGGFSFPQFRITGNGESLWLPVTAVQTLKLATAFDAIASEEPGERGVLADARTASRNALATYEDLLVRFPGLSWRLPIELRCDLLRRMLGQPIGDTGFYESRCRDLPDGGVKSAATNLLSVLRSWSGKQEDAGELQADAVNGLEILMAGGQCAIGENTFQEPRSPSQAVGPPDALGSEGAAWQPDTKDGARWLEVTFDPPVRTHGLDIMQSPVAGGVVAVDIIGPTGLSQRVLEPTNSFGGTISFPLSSWPVHAARIYVVSPDPHAPNGIDAVKIFSPGGDRWATGARGSEGRSDPLPDVPLSQHGRITNRYDRFTLTLASGHGVHCLSTTNGNVSLPAGEYFVSKQSVETRDAEGVAWKLSGTSPSDAPIRVDAGAQKGTSFGFPLTAKPVLSLNKESLSIDASLLGREGQKYGIPGLRRGDGRPPAPTFGIYDPDGTVVHSGKLEYG